MRKYFTTTCAGFLRTRDKYGGLSNFAGGYPITINDRIYRTSEAVYQCARFPDYPEVQQEIFDAKSPMTAKMLSKKYTELTRSDWNAGDPCAFKLRAMTWTLYAKWFCNFKKFSEALLETEHLDIVELSNKDDFWGAMPQPDGSYFGRNELGLMLSAMRDRLYVQDDLDMFMAGTSIMPINDTFKFFGEIPKQIMINHN